MSDIPDNANDGCVGPNSSNAGKEKNCEGCPNQSNCASGNGIQGDGERCLVFHSTFQHVFLR